jgi:hypothetical protein
VRFAAVPLVAIVILASSFVSLVLTLAVLVSEHLRSRGDPCPRGSQDGRWLATFE